MSAAQARLDAAKVLMRLAQREFDEALADLLAEQEWRVEVRALLAEVYKDEGRDIWMTARHDDWGLTVSEMYEAGRADEVLAKIERLTTGAAS